MLTSNRNALPAFYTVFCVLFRAKKRSLREENAMKLVTRHIKLRNDEKLVVRPSFTNVLENRSKKTLNIEEMRRFAHHARAMALSLP